MNDIYNTFISSLTIKHTFYIQSTSIKDVNKNPNWFKTPFKDILNKNRYMLEKGKCL